MGNIEDNDISVYLIEQNVKRTVPSMAVFKIYQDNEDIGKIMKVLNIWKEPALIVVGMEDIFVENNRSKDKIEINENCTLYFLGLYDTYYNLQILKQSRIRDLVPSPYSLNNLQKLLQQMLLEDKYEFLEKGV